MALTSPRFTSSNTLKNVEANRAKLEKGAEGRPVHLVQMALLDLNYAMPRSTGGVNYSPDGIYGEETKAVVKKFQKDSRTLTDDGVVGQKTIQELDRRLNSFQHRVKLHFRSIALTNIPFKKSLANAETVFAQYGIKVEFGSGESILLSEDETKLFEQIDQECTWDLNDGEFNQLQGLGTRAPSNDILVFHVSRFSGTALGCGGHAKDRPACTITASALAWDTAHEVCHVLLGSSFSPVHIEDRRNLMFPTSRTVESIPTLTNQQVTQMRQSVCCQAI
jgi:hypothetical protein